MPISDYVPAWARRAFLTEQKPAAAVADPASVINDPPEKPALLPAAAIGLSPYNMFGGLTPNGLRYNPDDLLSRKGFDIYKRMMCDEQVKAVVRFKISAIIARGHFFELDDESLGEEECKRRIRLFEEIVAQMGGGFNTGLLKIMRCVYQGFSITEKVHTTFDWTEDKKPYIGLKELKARPFETFKFRVDEFGNIIALVQCVPAREEREVPLHRVVYMVHNSDVDEHYGQSDLRDAHRDWFSKDMAIRFRNVYLERMAGGMTFFEVDSGITIQQGSADWLVMQKLMDNMSAATAALLPKGVKANIIMPGTTPVFGETITACNLGIAKALLVPNLLGISEAGQTGAYAQSKTQFDAFVWTVTELGGNCEDTVQEQVFDELGRLNFADGIAPKFRFKPLSEDRKFELMKIWKDLVTSGAVEASDTDEAHARNLLEFPAKGKPLAKPVVPGQPGKPGDPNADPEADDALDETIIGRGGVMREHARHGSINVPRHAYIAAVKRVEFKVIDSKTRAIEAEGVNMLHSAVKSAAQAMVQSIKDMGPQQALDVGAVEFSGPAKSAVRRAFLSPMKDSALLATRLASAELASAGRKNLTRKKFTPIANDVLLQNVLPYIDSRSYTSTGVLVSDVEGIVQNSVLQGIKAGSSPQQIADDAYTQLGNRGFLDSDDIRELTNMTAEQAEALGLDELTLARLNTSIRTNVFDAFNDARLEYFTDPALDGFVEALEYSAILDENTTDICEELNGEVWAADSDTVAQYNPPNHFNCRSIMVPIVEGDAWTKSADPEVKPADGFGS